MWVRVLPRVKGSFAAELTCEPFILSTGSEACFVRIYVEKNSKIRECYLNKRRLVLMAQSL